MRKITGTAGHAMTMRERMLAVILGQEHDRVPFAMYEIMLPKQEAFDLLGHGRIGIIRFCSIYRAENPNCRFEHEFFIEGETKCQRTILHTPKGDLTELRIFEPTFDSSTARKHFIETREDYELLWSYLEDSVILDNYDRYYRTARSWARTASRRRRSSAPPGSSSGSSGWGWRRYPCTWRTGRSTSSTPSTCWNVAPGRPSRSPTARPRRSSSWWTTSRRRPSARRAFASIALPLYDELGGMLAERGTRVLVHMDGLLKPLW